MEMTDLGIGRTEDRFFPFDAVRVAAQRVLNADNRHAFQYAPSEGLTEMRQELARYLTARTGRKVSAENLLMTNGASHALDLVLKKLVPAGSAVAVDDPTYFFALNILRDWDIDLRPIPVREDGLDLDRLEHEIRTRDVKMLYTIPIHHNPTGRMFSRENREGIVALAERHGVIVASDEVYQFVGDEVQESLFTGNEANILSIGSFAKTLASGVRTGWIHGPRPLIDRLAKCGVLISGGGVAPVMSLVLAQMLASGTQDEVLASLNAVYNARRRALCMVLERDLPQEVRFAAPTGGFFCWLEAPEDLDMQAVLAEAQRRGVSFRLGSDCSSAGNFANCIRLGFSYYGETRLETAGAILCDVLKKALAAR